MTVQMPKGMTDEEHLEWRGCKSKRSFETKRRAKEYIKALKKTGNRKNYPYSCLYCDGWHLTRLKQ